MLTHNLPDLQMFESGLLHILRRLNIQRVQGTLKLRADVLGEPEQEGSFLAVGLGEDRVLVVEIVERLGELVGVLGPVGVGRKNSIRGSCRHLREPIHMVESSENSRGSHSVTVPVGNSI